MSHNLLTISDLTRKDIVALFTRTDKIRERRTTAVVNSSQLGGLLFFEASTRTRIGFEAAAWKLGIQTVVMNETKNNTRMSEGESIRDTIRTLNPYVTFFCIRHPDENIFSEVLPFTDHPVINCGNGYDEHPTQALIDAYAIWTKFGTLDGLTITMIGDLRYTRSVHSLLLLLSRFSDVTVQQFAPKQLQLQDVHLQSFLANNTLTSSSAPHWGKEQVVYVAGFPPVNPSGVFPQTVRNKYTITPMVVGQLKAECIILNPLPRIDEISEAVDSSPNAFYFQQNELGLAVRMAILEQFCL